MIRESDGTVAHVTAGFGQISVNDEEFVPRAHIDIIDSNGCGHPGHPCSGNQVVMGPMEWAQLVRQMVNVAYTLGGPYRDYMETEMRKQRHQFN